MIVAFSVAPSGGAPAGAEADSVHDAVAAAVRVVRESGVPNQTSSMFTEIEGEWDEVFDVVKRATEAAAAFAAAAPSASLAASGTCRNRNGRGSRRGRSG